MLRKGGEKEQGRSSCCYRSSSSLSFFSFFVLLFSLSLSLSLFSLFIDTPWRNKQQQKQQHKTE